MKYRNLIESLYESSICLKKISRSIKESLKSEKVYKWIIGGITIYAIPAAYRFILRTENFPLPKVEPFYVGLVYFPSNIIEKLLVNSISPGGIGAVFGEKFFELLLDEKLNGLEKYLSRVTGSFAAVTVWTTLQYVGYVISEKYSIIGPHGKNIFEGPEIYPVNYLIALLISPLVPSIVEYLRIKLNKYTSHD